jgi:four helix bundle protein
MGKPHEQSEPRKFAMQPVKAVYQITPGFPTEERYGLAQQMRGAAVSIPSNIAEGARRNGAKEYLHYIGVARGSLAEMETQMQLAVILWFTTADHAAFDLADRIGKLLTGLHKKWSPA